MLKNDFIEIGRTECYFIDYGAFRILRGVIIGYDNITHLVTIRYKTSKDQYYKLYRKRPFIWFVLEDCYAWFIDYLKGLSMPELRAIDLTDQLDGEKTVLELPEKIGSSYTVYLNGLRQDRNDFIIDDSNKTLTIGIDIIPDQNDILTIEYLYAFTDIPE